MLANLLTISRIIVSPLIFFINENYMITLLLLAGLTDFFDGYLARKNNKESKLGSILDPLADKFFLNTLLIFYYSKNILPLWSVAIFLIKDIMLILFFIPLRNTNFQIKPILMSKLSTALLFLASILIASTYSKEGIAIIYLSLALTLYSFIIYVNYAIRYILGGSK